MSEYITTYTGKHFNPTQPNPDLISIQDIAHADVRMMLGSKALL